MAEPLLRTVIRKTPGNHTTVAPECDEHCLRWGELPHAHICPDGLFEEHPFLDVTAWCSCGKRLGNPVHVDVREKDGYRVRMEAAGRMFAILLKAHMQSAHGIDIEQDEAWLRALGTAP